MTFGIVQLYHRFPRRSITSSDRITKLSTILSDAQPIADPKGCFTRCQGTYVRLSLEYISMYRYRLATFYGNNLRHAARATARRYNYQSFFPKFPPSPSHRREYRDSIRTEDII